MLRYLFLCFSLFMPMRISTLRSLKTFQSYNNWIVCMVPPPGAHSSKMADSGKLLEGGCEVNSEIVYHDNGDTTDTTRPDFESGKNMFFGSAPKGSPGGSSSKKR